MLVHEGKVRHTAGISGSQLWALSEIARSVAMSVNAPSRRWPNPIYCIKCFGHHV